MRLHTHVISNQKDSGFDSQQSSPRISFTFMHCAGMEARNLHGSTAIEISQCFHKANAGHLSGPNRSLGGATAPAVVDDRVEGLSSVEERGDVVPCCIYDPINAISQNPLPFVSNQFQGPPIIL